MSFPPPPPPKRRPPSSPPAPPADRRARVQATFNSALERPTADREAYLVTACSDDSDVEREVRGLLTAHSAAAGFLDTEAPLSPEIERELARLKPEESRERIGNYKLLEQIGVGGFGTVWVAEQEKPVRRRVALKIIKMGMDTKEVIARFEQERQVLALMDHPNIAKVFDAGATQWGRPYFVMELVRGIKITDYCDQAKLPTAERLALFIQVCNAVQHAHQKGIIHRDLKPSNILVTLHDGVPVPKVIDFGVAKATQQQRLTDLTVYTQFEQMIGTPLYMSPEQAEMSGLDVDTRSDIYSLGVLLYELLTGRTPFDPAALMRQGLDEIRRNIREQEPQTPSLFVRTLALDARTQVAQHRQTDGAKLAGLIRGDLDWIVMKALEKNRARRYETANDFSRDIQLHLENQPVLASPPSQLYRVGRLIRRNRVAVAATVALLVGLNVVSGFGWLAWHERKLREAVETELALANKRFADGPQFPEGNEFADQPNVAPIITAAAPSPFPPLSKQGTPVSPTPNPTRATPSPPTMQDALKASMIVAQRLEEEGKWALALDAWLRIARESTSGVGKNHLETLLNHLRDRPSPITFEEFTAMRTQITEAAQFDILSAMMLIGDNLRTVEPEVAFNWFSAAAAKGDAGALTQLGFLLSKNSGPLKADLVKAAEYFQTAADKGDIGGKFALGRCYITGHGLPAKDEKRGAELLREASDAGDLRAMNSLGDCYTHGTGVKEDFNEAFKLFTRAADKGNLKALGNLGALYMTGRGVPAANVRKGAELFERGARAGESTCMFNFAQCLGDGLGVAKNELEAQFWYRKAAEVGELRAAEWCRNHNVPFAPG